MAGAPSHALKVRITSKWWSKRSERIPALRDIDIDISSGECAAIMGLSGVGKSTLLKVIAGLDSRFEGQVTVDERATDASVGDVKLVHQANRLYEHMTALENVVFGLPDGAVGADRTARSWLDRVGLADKAALFPKDLSEGQRKRVAIARILVDPPKFLLLDEPLAGLDPENSRKISQEIRDLQAEFGFGCLITTHDPVEAISLADRAYILKGSPASIDRTISLAQTADGVAYARVMDDILSSFKTS